MFTYPGEGSLAEALRALEGRRDLSGGEEKRVQDLLAEAVGDGLSLEGVRRATSSFHGLSERRGAAESRRVGDSIQLGLAEGWVERIALFPPEEQVGLLSRLDADHAAWLSGARGDGAALERCVEFVRDHPIPAWRTAEVVVRTVWERAAEQAPLVDAMLRVVESSSTDPAALWFAEHRRSEFAFSRELCLRRHREAEVALSGSARARAQRRREALERLIALDGSLETLLGSRWAVCDGPAIVRTALTPVRTWINGAYAAHDDGADPMDPFVRWYVDYLWARVLTATCDLEGAVKSLREALELGACPGETRGFLSALLDHLGQRDEALEVMAEAVRCEPPEHRPDGSPMPSTWERSFREARGDPPPELARATEPPRRFVDAAERNQSRTESQVLPLLAERRDAAVAGFWGRAAEAIPLVFADVVSPEDLDAALDGREPGDRARLSSARVAAAHLDEVPLDGSVDRDLLLRAAEEDVPRSQIAAEALKLLEPDEQDDAAFERNVARLPAYGRSLVVARRRLAAALARGDGARVDALIALAERLGDAEAAAACFEEAHPVMSAGAGALGWLTAGARLSRRSPALAERVGGLVRGALLAGLETTSDPVPWLAALLDLDPERIETHEIACAWLEQGAGSGEDSGSTLAAAEFLAGELTGDHRARAAGVARELLLRRLHASSDPEDCRSLADRLVKLGVDEATGARLARWYRGWRSAEVHGSRARKAALGEWLLAHLAGEACGPVRDAVGEHLVAELEAARATPDRIPWLERLSRLFPDDARWSAQLVRARKAGSGGRRRKAAVAVAAALAGGVAVLLVTRARTGPAAVAAGARAGVGSTADATREHARWSVRSALAFRGGEPTPAFASVVRALGAPAGEEGKPVAPDELRQLLDDPRAGEVYGAELVKHASPRSEESERAERGSRLDAVMRPAKIGEGVAFLSEHAAELEAARTKYGVEPEDVVSVLMWESNLGANTRRYRTANVYLGEILYLDDALAEAERTGGAMPPGPARDAHLARLARVKRSAERELVALLRFCKAKGLDPLRVTGSWRGAIGLPQLVPTSFRYAVDGDGDGVVDLYTFHDAIPSVASQLGAHGYREDRVEALRAYDLEEGDVRGVQMYAEAIAARSRGASDPVAAAPAAARPQAAAGPSFDCAEASLDAEREICSDEHLAALDREMVAAYRSLQAATTGPEVRKAQRRWLEEVRNACSTRECLGRVYAERIVDLRRSLAQ
jgi:membrane-bound lytic murein transglycosylase B